MKFEEEQVKQLEMEQFSQLEKRVSDLEKQEIKLLYNRELLYRKEKE